MIIEQKRKEIRDKQRFYAMFKGVDLDKETKNGTEQRLEEVQRRAAAQLAGSEEELERQEFADLGFDFGSA